jgi:hypothetical protein
MNDISIILDSLAKEQTNSFRHGLLQQQGSFLGTDEAGVETACAPGVGGL